MRHWGFACAAAVGAVWLSGCGWQPGASSSKGGMAVVDLDLVAKSLKSDVEMNEKIKVREATLQNELIKLDKKFQQEIKDKTEEAGETPTDEQKKELQQLPVLAQMQLQKVKRQVQADLNAYSQRLKQQFRNEIRPVAQEIAAAKGLGIVIPKNEGLLLSVDPGVDITIEVMQAMQGKRPNLELPAAAPAKTDKEKKPAQTADAAKSGKN